MPKNEYWKGCRGRYVSIGIEEQLDTTWWEELQDAWDLNLPNIIFQGSIPLCDLKWPGIVETLDGPPKMVFQPDSSNNALLWS